MGFATHTFPTIATTYQTTVTVSRINSYFVQRIFDTLGIWQAATKLPNGQP